MSDFKVGDVVRLRSGGPEMTVTATNLGESKNLRCEWFESGSVKISTFPAAALEKAADSRASGVFIE